MEKENEYSFEYLREEADGENAIIEESTGIKYIVDLKLNFEYINPYVEEFEVVETVDENGKFIDEDDIPEELNKAFWDTYKDYCEWYLRERRENGYWSWRKSDY